MWPYEKNSPTRGGGICKAAASHHLMGFGCERERHLGLLSLSLSLIVSPTREERGGVQKK
jgi:hypothetical protein